MKIQISDNHAKQNCFSKTYLRFNQFKKKIGIVYAFMVKTITRAVEENRK